ncbi:hypothetical protein AKJ08_1100 [Vulgatibacter incomptus]|uniref:Uncharacterized protein n=1 Tax=Vulgatibacter incomptus TaxID=1391653 RepID=A0A0K1PB15_9BACT|nr:hypothetical protein AKJ08_1100 [Vulgatibacter incomptus]
MSNVGAPGRGDPPDEERNSSLLGFRPVERHIEGAAFDADAILVAGNPAHRGLATASSATAVAATCASGPGVAAMTAAPACSSASARASLACVATAAALSRSARVAASLAGATAAGSGVARGSSGPELACGSAAATRVVTAADPEGKRQDSQCRDREPRSYSRHSYLQGRQASPPNEPHSGSRIRHSE